MPIHNGHCVSYGVESWFGVLDWSHGVEYWSGTLECNWSAMCKRNIYSGGKIGLVLMDAIAKHVTNALPV